MTTYSVDYLERLLLAVGDFEKAFDAWMATQVESDHMSSRGLFPTVWPREGVTEAQIRPLALAVAEAAGTAARAVAVTGSLIGVAGVGALDPIANWSMMSAPKALFTPSDIRSIAATVRGRLKALIEDAQANDDSGVPPFAPAQLHSTIWAAAANHWTTHEYRVAVREAAEALTVHWKTRFGRNDVDDTVFWQQTLSPGDPTPGAPKLVWPGDPSDKTVRSMKAGLNHLATGLNLTVRNVTTHSRDGLTEQEGMERLAAYSFLARQLDRCQVRRADAIDPALDLPA
ncbi:TIGR02391 family protein [Microbacterium sp. NPDC077663]|uniref:TIGR02391 family protein n=1 Tax=Microbacterium sp. NPDC077663 TaxID=3364189 RepID=UPI0037C5C1A3